MGGMGGVCVRENERPNKICSGWAREPDLSSMPKCSSDLTSQTSLQHSSLFKARKCSDLKGGRTSRAFSPISFFVSLNFRTSE